MKRRDFIKFLSLSSLLLKESSVWAYEHKKRVQEPSEPLNYVLFNMYDAPSRWNFDLILGSNKHAPNPHPYIFNKIRDNRFFHETFNIRGLNFPPIWKRKYTVENQISTLSQYLDNMILIRGCDMLTDGHDINNMRLEKPAANSESIIGSLSRFSDTVFNSVFCPNEIGSNANATDTFLSYDKMKSTILLEQAESYFSQLFTEDYSLEKANPSLRSFLIKDLSNRYHSELESKLKKIEKIDIKKLYEQYIKRVKVYKKIITQGLKVSNIRKLISFDLPSLKEYSLSKTKKFHKEALFAFRLNDYIVANEDILSIFKDCHMNNFAESFAITEILLKEGLIKSSIINLDVIKNINIENSIPFKDLHKINRFEDIDKYSKTKPQNDNSYYEFDYDAHRTGNIINFLNTEVTFNITSNILLEFLNYLKKHNLFDKTLVNISSEFNRLPTNSLGGSEHGFNGQNSTLISGTIKEFHLLGNIYKETSKEKATWGHGAPVKELQSSIRYENTANTICSLLKIPSIVSAQSLVRRSGSSIRTTIEEGRIIT